MLLSSPGTYITNKSYSIVYAVAHEIWTTFKINYGNHLIQRYKMLLLQKYSKYLRSLQTIGTIINKEIPHFTGQKRGFAAVFDMDSDGVSELNRIFLLYCFLLLLL